MDLLGSIEGDEKAVERHASALALPYGADELQNTRDTLLARDNVAPVHLPAPGDIDPPLRVVRRKDLDDLFDTDADLTGFDVDIATVRARRRGHRRPGLLARTAERRGQARPCCSLRTSANLEASSLAPSPIRREGVIDGERN